MTFISNSSGFVRDETWAKVKQVGLKGGIGGVTNSYFYIGEKKNNHQRK